MSKLKATSFLVLAWLLSNSLFAYAQTHKGISFQGVIKLPSGELPTKSGLTVNSIILSPNNCILREEQFVGVSIANGYINIPIGTGTVTGDDPGLSLKQVMDNSSTITQGPTKTSGLVCLDSNGNIDSGVTSFNPSSGDGRRKFRLNVTINSIPIVADFNMRSMAYAINAESADDSKKLNGKADTSFIQTSTNITQIAAESWFSSSALNSLISGTYNAPTATSATSASTLSATLPINKGGTNLTTTGAANQILGVNAGANGLEYKTLTAGSNVTLTHGANSITINATGGGGGGAETDPSVQAFAKNAVSTGLTVNGSNQLTVSYGTTAGTAAEGNDSRIAGAFQSATTLGGDLSGTLPNPTVARLNGVSVSTAVGADNGKFLKYSSASSGSWSAQFMTLSDLKNSLGTQSAFSFAGCTQAQTLTWSSVTDQMTCQAINGVPAANITGLGSLAAKSSADLATADVTGVLPIANGGTGAATVAQNLIFAGPTSGTGAPSFRSLVAADLPASASYWSSATGGINYAGGGNVGIGTTTPDAVMDVSGGVARIKGAASWGSSPTTGKGLEFGYDTTSDFGLISSYSRSGAAYKGMYVDASPLAINGLSGANVGVGSLSPQEQLHVGNETNKFALFNFNNPATAPASHLGFIIGANYSNGGGETNFWNGFEAATTSFDFRQKTGAATFSTLMTLKPSGYVGIGTTSPSDILQIKKQNSNVVFSEITVGAGGPQASVPSMTFSGTPSGIGAPSWDGWTKFHYSTSGFSISHLGSVAGAGVPLGPAGLGLATGGRDNDLYIDPNGKVGIGTSSPAAKLDVVGEVKFGNTSSTCDATNEGQQRYNSTSKNMEYCNGTAWTAYDVSGGGRTSCPAGFTLIGTSGSAEAFCISSAQETSATWANANIACRGKTPKARLCSASEWAAACFDGAAGPNNMSGHSEWVADLYTGSAQLMGSSGCDSFSAAAVSGSNTSRCCFR